MHYDTDSLRNKLRSHEARANQMVHNASSLKVFLIEDSALLQELLAGILGELDGVQFCGSAEGEAEALRKLAENPVDLVIIDIELRQGSGIGVLDALQTDSDLYGNPRKAVLTNYAHASMRQRCERFGMDAFFDKSLHLNQLIDYVIDTERQKSGS
ncbi:response regulator [Thiobacillus denitrificans]|uniref:response regulator n=1 Tax=Thiobacillus denitrificans TaxID=36861 RepID=UPI001FDF4CDA|nr:response regulator [Thiobacillus denitrificans]